MPGGSVLLILTYFIIGVTVFVAWDIYRKRRIFKFSSQIPGYRFYPIIGNAHHFIGETFFASLQQLIKKHNLPCNIWAGHIYVYLTGDPSEIGVILNHQNTIEKSFSYKCLELVLGNTLVLQPYEHWKRNRKIFAKGFNQRTLNKQVGLYYEKSCGLVESLKTVSKGLQIDIFYEFILNIITTSFTEHDPLTPKEIQILGNRTKKFQEIISKRFLSVCPDFIFYRTSEGKQAIECVNTIRAIIDKIIQNKRKRLNEKKGSDLNQDDLPVIDEMIRNDTILADDEIRDEILFFILASIDTSSTALLFTLTFLGMHPEVQEKVYQEVIESVGLTNIITHNDLPNLKYTEMAIFESMRLIPPVPIIGRRASGDVDLGTRILPADSNIYISIFDVHRDERYWKNPLEYDPDRFLPSEVEKRHPYAFIPFSAGPKICLGMKTSTMVLKTAVANIVKNYRIHSNYKSVNDIQLESGVVITPTHSLDCTFVPRS